MYGLEVSLLNEADMRSLNVVVNRSFTKLFTVNIIDSVKLNQKDYFWFRFTWSAVIENRAERTVDSFQTAKTKPNDAIGHVWII